MPLWLTVCLVVLGALLAIGVVVYLLDRINHI